ncbi:DUF6228 family protein [Micromonospora sp. NPDC003816]|uniref:DUF6228 family protein n=1 Tax=Micromonospora sp. NPDC003816 TaxID=3364224 RepID=UPI0036759B09
MVASSARTSARVFRARRRSLTQIAPAALIDQGSASWHRASAGSDHLVLGQVRRTCGWQRVEPRSRSGASVRLGIGPETVALSVFLDPLAKGWEGWQGVRTWRSMERELCWRLARR